MHWHNFMYCDNVRYAPQQSLPLTREVAKIFDF